MKDKCVTGNRVWLEIDLQKLKSNFENIQKIVAPARVTAVLKADAYGLGAKKLAKTLVEAGVAGFAVAGLKEAIELLPFAKPVAIIGALLHEEVCDVVKNDIIAPVPNLEIAEKLNQEAERQGKIQECHFLLDTGMGRLGCLAKNAETLIKACKKLPNLNCCGIYSHFPVAYCKNSDFTTCQIQTLKNIVTSLEKQNITFEKIHIANSDAINNFLASYQKPFNFVRTGINLHGAFDDEGQRQMDLLQIISLKTRLVDIKRLPAGATIGYGCTYKLPKETLVGVISAGYADGLPLSLSNRGYVLIDDTPCPVLGRVSMDYTSVSLENLANPRLGAEVTCLGGNGIHAITIDDWSLLKGTNTYEIICSFGTRVTRIYCDGALKASKRSETMEEHARLS
jgi:alanine racemase